MIAPGGRQHGRSMRGDFHPLATGNFNQSESWVSIMRPSTLDLRMKDIVDRRLTRAPKSLLKSAFGFDVFGTRVWTHPSFFLIAIGTTKFLRLADQTFARAKHPFPGLVDLRAPNRDVAFLSQDSRMSSISNLGIQGFSQCIALEGECSFLLNQLNVSTSTGATFEVELIVGGSAQNAAIADFHLDTEMMLTKHLSSKR